MREAACRRRIPGYRIKNKNPTQSCGEKHKQTKHNPKNSTAGDIFSIEEDI